MPPQTPKQQIRAAMIDRIRALDPDQRRLQERLLVDRLPIAPGFGPAESVLIHVAAFADEVATRPMLDLILQAGKRLVCPRIILAQHRLDLFEVVDLERDLEPGFRSILEPSAECRRIDPRAIDWALVPGVAFDPQGYRLGRGGGYYDRLLPTFRPDAACWSLIFDVQWVAKVPREPHDQPLNGVMDFRSIQIGARSQPISGP